MVSYISSPDDGVQNFLEKHRWLECFVFSSDVANTGDESGELQRAYSEFELNPTGFVHNIQIFSKLLCTRDLCKRLFSYFGESPIIGSGILKERVELWIQLQAGISKITQSDRDGTLVSSIEDLTQWNRMQHSLDRMAETSAESSASNQLQRCLNRFREGKERNKAAQSK